MKNYKQLEQCIAFFLIFATDLTIITNIFITNITTMTDDRDLQTLQQCLDDYMVRTGRHEIDEIEANSALHRAGLLDDEEPHPGRPLREILMRLRDSNLLPQNIRQIYGAWKIKLSSTIAKTPLIIQFQE